MDYARFKGDIFLLTQASARHMKLDVLKQLNSAITGSKRKLLDLFIAKRMKLLIEVIEEF